MPPLNDASSVAEPRFLSISFLLVASGFLLISCSKDVGLLSLWEMMCKLNDSMGDAFFHLFLWVPISVLDLFGSILVCKRYRNLAITTTSTRRDGGVSRSWLECLISCTLMQFGGTTLTGLVLGQAPSWLVSHTAFPALLLAWWLTFFCPLDLFWRALHAPGVLFFTGIGSAISSGHAVTSWGLDKALNNAFHVNHVRIGQSLFTCILCGTLSACGGGLLSDWLGFFHEQSYVFISPPSFMQPNRYDAAAALTKSFYLSCLYYTLLHLPDQFAFPKTSGHLVVGLIQVAYYLFHSCFPDGHDIFHVLSKKILQALQITAVISTPEKDAFIKAQDHDHEFEEAFDEDLTEVQEKENEQKNYNTSSSSNRRRKGGEENYSLARNPKDKDIVHFSIECKLRRFDVSDPNPKEGGGAKGEWTDLGRGVFSIRSDAASKKRKMLFRNGAGKVMLNAAFFRSQTFEQVQGSVCFNAFVLSPDDDDTTVFKRFAVKALKQDEEELVSRLQGCVVECR